MAVDLDNRKGQFLVSASSDIRMMPEITESLAGRMSRIPLRTLAVGEIHGRKPLFLKRAFEGDFPRILEGGDKADVLRMAVRGGYPEVLALTPAERKGWYRDYIDNLLLHDLRDFANIRNLDTVKSVLYTFAAWSGKYMDVSGVLPKLGISRPTFNSYANALTGNLLLIDAKAGTSTGPEDFRHMRWFRDNLAPKDVKVRGIVLYSGKYVYTWRDGFMSVPTSALWM